VTVKVSLYVTVGLDNAGLDELCVLASYVIVSASEYEELGAWEDELCCWVARYVIVYPPWSVLVGVEAGVPTYVMVNASEYELDGLGVGVAEVAELTKRKPIKP
jgi:hypothetical protein